MELSSLRYNLIRYSNQSTLLFVSCQSLDPLSDPIAYYSAFIIHKPLIDSRPHWCWIRQVNLTDTTDPAFPSRWQRFQLAASSDYSIVRLQICLDSELFLDTFFQDTNPFGCRGTDTRGEPRDTDRYQLQANCRRMIQALEEVERAEVRRIKRTALAAAIYSLLGLASCAALVWLVVRQGRPSRQTQAGDEPSTNLPTGRDVPAGSRVIIVRRNTEPAQVISTHM